jgi:hypothetical protein
MSNQFILDRPVSAESREGAFHIGGIPECDHGDDQVETAGSVSLILE